MMMNKIYTIKRSGIGKDSPNYLQLYRGNEPENGIVWRHWPTECTFFSRIEEVFMVLNKIKNRAGKGDVDYHVIEIEINETCVDISTTPSEEKDE